jgi:hypothetical protein
MYKIPDLQPWIAFIPVQTQFWSQNKDEIKPLHSKYMSQWPE